MRRILAIGLCLLVTAAAVAQNISVKSMTTDPNDTWARRKSSLRLDSDGQKCAVVKVGIVGVRDLVFPDAVGEVAYGLSEYTVYVSPGLETFRYANQAGTVKGSVRFADYISGAKGAVTQQLYRLNLDSGGNLRAAIFAITPTSATLTVDGKHVQLNSDGMASVEKPIGTYTYSVSAPGYEGSTGRVSLTENDITMTQEVILEQITHTVTLSGVPQGATLFIDDETYEGDLGEVEIPEGNHKLHFVAEGYDDLVQTVNVTADSQLSITMQQKKEKVVVHRDERTRRKANLPIDFYISGGGSLFDKSKYLSQKFSIHGHLSVMEHFGGIFGMRQAIGLGAAALDKNTMNETFEATVKDTTTLYVDVPIQIGFAFPFGAYNSHKFSLMAGGYGKYMWTKVEGLSDGKEEVGKWDFGLRATAQIDIKMVSIGFEVSQSRQGRGLYYSANIGLAMTRLKKY